MAAQSLIHELDNSKTRPAIPGQDVYRVGALRPAGPECHRGRADGERREFNYSQRQLIEA